MQPIKITIPGRYWDSFVYNGRMYLWDLDGSVQTIDWDRLISEWSVISRQRLALQCAFSMSDYLYKNDVRRLLGDLDIQKTMEDKFEQLVCESLIIGTRRFESYRLGQQDNPFPFPHSDLEIYQRNAYVAGPSGVTRASVGTSTRYPISTKTARHWDAPVLRMVAKHDSIALAAGSEGLFEASLRNLNGRVDPVRAFKPVRRGNDECDDCNWVYWSIFASNFNGGFLASFQSATKVNASNHSRQGMGAEFSGVLSGSELWGQGNYSWGIYDKFCLVTERGIRIMRYTPWLEAQSTEMIGEIPLKVLNQDLVSASIAPFGIVLELQDKMVVLTSKIDQFEVDGEPTNWRVFPESRHYCNQLHVIKEDCLEIYSFNHDYFVDQQTKLAGIRAPVVNYSLRQSVNSRSSQIAVN